MRSTALLGLFAPFSFVGACAPSSGDGDSVSGFESEQTANPEISGAAVAVDVDPDLDLDGSPASLDCDDADATSYPGASELDDLADNDCDGWVDEDFVTAGDIVVSEVNRQARFGGAVVVNNGTWVEVYNASSRTIDLANWVFTRGTSASGNSVTIDPTAAPLMAPGDYAVFCDTDDYQASAGTAYPLACDYVWGDETQVSTYQGTYHNNVFFLRRDNDTFGLYIEGSRTTGRLVDAVNWTFDATNGYWPRVATFSTSLDPAYLDGTYNDSKDAWCSTSSSASGSVSYSATWRWYDNTTSVRDEYGTPGAANYDCLNDPDIDADGYPSTTDCDDADPAINPAAAETCDGVDQDCDGIIDDGAGTDVAYADADADGYGDAASSIATCGVPAGYSADATDCDDADATSNPAGTEVCDGADNDCDGTADEGLTVGPNVFYADADVDGYGDAASTTTACTVPTGYLGDATDCDDTSAAINPAAMEADNLGDDDCDGWIDEDFIASGDIVVTEVNRQSRFGGAAVINNGSWVEVYNASSRTIDLSNWVFVRGTTSSGDSVTIDPLAAPILGAGAYAVFCDTDDYLASAGTAYPLACDYVWGDEAQASTYVGTYHNNLFYLRRDSDTFGLYVEGSRTTGRLIDDVSWTYDATDGYWPRVATFSTSLDPAYLDGVLNDAEAAWCSTSSSAGGAGIYDAAWNWYDVPATTRDEYGTPGAANYGCLSDPDVDLDGYVASVDCDDADASINPGATETCDGVDEDCDGLVDEGVGATTSYADADSDTYGDAATSTVACTAPAGYVADATDCDDGDAAINPGAAEVCDDGIDNDCDPDPTVCEWSGAEVASASYDFRGYGTAALYSVGSSIANNGDFNDDGFDDVVVGQNAWDTAPATDNGRAYIWYGPVDTADTLSSASLTIDGDTSRNNDGLGTASRFVGDVDADGIDDLIVSAIRSHTDDRGTAYLFLGGTTPTTVSDAFASFSVSTVSNSNYTGLAIDGADTDGDLASDILVTAYGRSSGAGAVGLWNSSAIGGGGEALDTAATLLITGVTAADNLGYSARLAPDIDGDGLPDLLVGAPAASSTTTPGKAYLFYGLDVLSGTLSASSADATINGSANGDHFGISVAGLGDSDGDGYNDFLVTADMNDTSASDAGATYVFTSAPTGSVTGSAEASSIITGEVASDFFGRSASDVGDVNGDGFADLMVGATGYEVGPLIGAGAMYVVYGPAPAGTTSAGVYDLRLEGANTADAVGYGVAGGGDVNADGIADFMGAAPSWDGYGYLNAGGTWLYYGRGE